MPGNKYIKKEIETGLGKTKKEDEG